MNKLFYILFLLTACSGTDEVLETHCELSKNISLTKVSGNCWEVNDQDIKVKNNLFFIYNDDCEVLKNKNGCFLDYEINCPFNFEKERYFSITQTVSIDLISNTGTFNLEYYNADNKCNSTYMIDVK